MARLVEVQDLRLVRSLLVLQSGDVLVLHATGGTIRSGAGIIELLGIFRSALLGDTGQILTPAGLPDVVLFRATQEGRGVIGVVTGGTFAAPETIELSIDVQPENS